MRRTSRVRRSKPACVGASSMPSRRSASSRAGSRTAPLLVGSDISAPLTGCDAAHKSSSGRIDRANVIQTVKWCPRRDSNPRPQDLSHFGFRRRPRGRSWSGLSLRHRPKPVGAARPVSTPSRPFEPGLARDRQSASAPQLSPTLSGSAARFPSATPNFQQGILCSILLSYADTYLLDASIPRPSSSRNPLRPSSTARRRLAPGRARPARGRRLLLFLRRLGRRHARALRDVGDDLHRSVRTARRGAAPR